MSNTDTSCEREGTFVHVVCGGFIETCVCYLSPLKSCHFSTFFSFTCKQLEMPLVGIMGHATITQVLGIMKC